jgi:GT2 family glycosyltransferase
MIYDLSIVIPVFNNWSYTKNCISNLLKLPESFEIIIVDNASSDLTKTELSKFERVKHIRNETNFGFGKAVSQGVQAAQSNQIMILNNDIKFGNVFQDWFLSLPQIIKDNNKLIGPTAGYVDPENEFSFVYETSNKEDKINYMSGWCLSANRETWDKLETGDGPFDSKTFFLYFEDTDLSFRAKSLNIDFMLIDTPLKHIGKQTSKLLNISKHYSESKVKFLNKWNNKYPF